MSAAWLISTVFHAVLGLTVATFGIFALIQAFSLLFRRPIIPRSTWKTAVKFGVAGSLGMFVAASLFSCVIAGNCPTAPPLDRWWPRDADRERIVERTAQETVRKEERDWSSR